MMRAAKLCLSVGLLALANDALSEPRFASRAADLPVQHIYSGGWEHFVGGGIAIFDCNGDARPDFLAAGGQGPTHLFINETDGPGAALRFTAQSLDDLTGVTGAYPLDIDSDGHLDLAVLRVGTNRLLKGDGACGFTDASAAWGIDGRAAWSTAFSATWEGGSDWPTLAIGNYVDRDNTEGPFGACSDNALHRPGPGGYTVTLLSPGYCALSMLISDWQRSGAPELRISNDRHYYVKGGYEQMWELAPLRSRGASDGWPRLSIWGMGIASADVDGNGFPDVMLTSMGDQVLQFNAGRALSNAPFDTGIAAQRPHLGDDGRPSTGWHAEFGDVDNDGRLDLFIAKGNVDQMPSNAMEDPNNLLMQGADSRFTEAAGPAGIATTDRARGAGFADFDGDGRLDLVVNNRRAPLELWQNETPQTGAWARVQLRQVGTNTQAVGAWIEIRSDIGTQVHEITVGGGHASGSALPVHFGLADASNAEMRILWPGRSDWSNWRDLPLNTVTEIRR